MLNTSLVWFRNDLRTIDNPALFEARERGPVVAVFLLAQEQWQSHHVAPRRLSFLKKSLSLLQQDLLALNIPLLVRPAPLFADAAATITALARQWNAQRVFCNAEYPLNEQRRDRDVFKACRDAGIDFERHHGGVIVAPGTLRTQAQKPYTVFTPFKRRWLETLTPDAWTPLPVPEAQQKISGYSASDDTATLEAIASLPDHNIDQWPAGEAEATSRLHRFLDERVEDYQRLRDFPAREGTSQLSPYLSIGAISARSCLAAARRRNGIRLNVTPGQNKGLDTWVSELIWREFYRHVCADFPHISRGAAFKRETDRLRWRHDPEQFDRWREGMTGYPLVDAGMRQLKETGWMHNRVRMITAMFLSKHLLLDWRLGERHFMETLIDGDFAANNGGWQWSASTGTDAVPYFRIFNPTSQQKKFDPTRVYIDRWVPELRDGTADSSYPEPLVDHAAARERALAFFKRG
jgi:deoxyribodipyrimidine photo-lyase